MSFFNNVNQFDTEAAKSNAFQNQVVPEGVWQAQITEAEVENTVTGDNSKYPGKQVEYFKFGADLIINGEVMSYQERFMVSHELANTDNFKGLVARGQLNAHNLLTVFGLANQPVDPSQLPVMLVGKRLVIEMGVKKKNQDYPNYIKSFQADGGNQQQNTVTNTNMNSQNTMGQQVGNQMGNSQNQMPQNQSAPVGQNVGVQQNAASPSNNPNPFGANNNNFQQAG